VAGINRNGWPASSGIAGRNRPEYAITGRSKKTARQTGCQLLTIVNIQERITELQQNLIEKAREH
jgi:phage terminase small subunit